MLCDKLEAAHDQREARRDSMAAATLSRLSEPNLNADNFAMDARFALQSLTNLTERPEQIKQLRRAIFNLAVLGKVSSAKGRRRFRQTHSWLAFWRRRI